MRPRDLLPDWAQRRGGSRAGAARDRRGPRGRPPFDDASLLHPARLRRALCRNRYRQRHRRRRERRLRPRCAPGRAARGVLPLPGLRRHAGAARRPRRAPHGRVRERPLGGRLAADVARCGAPPRDGPARALGASFGHHPLPRHPAVDGGDAAGPAARPEGGRLPCRRARAGGERAAAGADASRQGMDVGDGGHHRRAAASDRARHAPSRGNPSR